MRSLYLNSIIYNKMLTSMLTTKNDDDQIMVDLKNE